MFWKSDYTEKLIEISGKESVLTEKSSLISYENDGLGFHRYTPDCVVII
ncbi:MAG: hypothetical protein HRT89_24345, partial [Lentisphaeria bacterium]|nr:hypothetical protein [Lentisphaeria bacterium]